MSINGVKIDLDYKNLYFVLKEKYDKLKVEIEQQDQALEWKKLKIQNIH